MAVERRIPTKKKQLKEEAAAKAAKRSYAAQEREQKMLVSLMSVFPFSFCEIFEQRQTVQHMHYTATHCNTLQHTATHVRLTHVPHRYDLGMEMHRTKMYQRANLEKPPLVSWLEQRRRDLNSAQS